jgi:hypothetical protein
MDNNDIINNSIIKIESLEKEYNIVLKRYEEAYKNFINSLNNYPQNPCKGYNFQSTGISQECYNKIWSDQGCTTKAPDVTANWQRSQTYDTLVKDSYLLSTDQTNRKICYGDNFKMQESFKNNKPIKVKNNVFDNFKSYNKDAGDNTKKYNTNKNPTYSLGTDYDILPNRTWWGTYGIKENAANTTDECISMCASDMNCTGATFDSVKRYCWIRGGDGTVTVGSSNETALIPKLKVDIIELSKINNNLISINQKLRNEIENINPILKEEKASYFKKQKQFDEYYNKLIDEKKGIVNLLEQYNTVESELNDQTLTVDQMNTSLRLWYVLAIILLLIVLKQIYGIETFKMKYIIIIIIFIFLSFSLSKPTGFVTLGFVVITIFVYKINFPSEEII